MFNEGSVDWSPLLETRVSISVFTLVFQLVINFIWRAYNYSQKVSTFVSSIAQRHLTTTLFYTNPAACVLIGANRPENMTSLLSKFGMSITDMESG